MFAIFENARTHLVSEFPTLLTFATSSSATLQKQAYLDNSNASVRYYSLILLAFITRWAPLEATSGLNGTLENILRADQNFLVRLAACCMLIPPALAVVNICTFYPVG